ncbi:MAG TPA: hypothetical protein VEJ87_11700 [Acidimicrobiales bacterium]|nr:hypothetical protein [Acidimicrobiales bacterium]
MGPSDVVLVVSVFLVSAVEMVEALTIVLAVAVTRGWRAAALGAATALAVLAVMVGAFGPALVHVPLDALRTVVGFLLLVLGLQWLRKAILRAVGLKAKHDEDAIFAETVTELSEHESDRSDLVSDGAPSSEPASRAESAGYLVAFKGVFLEGLEVVVIVLTLGAASHRIGLAAAAAGAALVPVAIAGAIVARQLSGVPENAMKFTVGVMLVSFGSFWVAEGLGLHWPGSDLALVVLVGIYAIASASTVWWLRRTLQPVDRRKATTLGPSSAELV